jgi:hypothetical protein
MYGCRRREPPTWLRALEGRRRRAKSGKKKRKRKVTDLAEEGEGEMPVSGGGSSSSAPEFETTKKICFDLSHSQLLFACLL